MKTPSLSFFTAIISLSVCVIAAAGQTAKPAKFIEVPFELHRNSVIIQVKVNGKGPFSMLLDTGTSPSALDRDAAVEMGLTIGKDNLGGRGTGTDEIESFTTSIHDLQIGGLKAANVEARVVERLSNIGKQLGRPLHGVLGYSLLKGRVVQFDYPARTIRFYSGSFTPKRKPGNSAVKRFKLLDDTPMIEDIRINGKKVSATLDTGSNGSVRLTAAATKRLGLEETAADSAAVNATGFGGTAIYRKGVLSSLAIGAVNAAEIEVIYVMKDKEDVKTADCNLGNAFFSAFSVLFDYQKRLVVFERKPAVTN
jgi:predicted aspartyl protease